MNLDALVNSVILQRTDHLQASPVTHVSQSWVGMPTEVSLHNLAVARSIEYRAPRFEFADSISSLLGGALAFWLGRKRTYFLLCIGALVCTQFLFRVESPIDSTTLFTITMFGRNLPITEYLGWVFGLGFFSGFFFGWLPLCLPEMFPTRVRSTGAGVSFNWGRILTGFGVLASAIALKELFKGDYAQVGRITGFIYAVGLVVIVLAPIGKYEGLED